MHKAPDLMPSVEVCDALGIDRSTLSRWVASGRIRPTVRAPGRRGAMFFTRPDVDRLGAEIRSSNRTALPAAS
jgi:predicted site-specific integrase-resolvase